MKYKTVYQKSEAQIVEKKSRFIAEVFPVSSETEAEAVLDQVKKKYWDARHHCWAYVIGTNQVQKRLSDDGEPSGTAGKPILEVLEGKELHNVLLVVTRYFGGTLLGTGGLVRAYSSAAKTSLEHSTIITRIYGFKLKISTDYTGLGKIQYILGQRKIPVLDSQYTEQVELTILVPEAEAESVTALIREETNAQAETVKVGECWFADVDGRLEVSE